MDKIIPFIDWFTSYEKYAVIERSAIGLSSENEAEEHTDQETVFIAIEKDCICNTEGIVFLCLHQRRLHL